MWKSASAIGSLWSRLTAVSLLNVSSIDPRAPVPAVCPAPPGCGPGSSSVSSSSGPIPVVEPCSTTTIDSSCREGARSASVEDKAVSSRSGADMPALVHSSSSSSRPRRTNQNSTAPASSTAPAMIRTQVFVAMPIILSSSDGSARAGVEITLLGGWIAVSASSSAAASAASVSSGSASNSSSGASSSSASTVS